MSCNDVREHLHAWSDGERLGDLRQEVAVLRHVLVCPDCRARWRQFQRLRRTARRLPSTLPEVLAPLILTQLAQLSPEMNPSADADLPKLSLTKEMKMRKRLTAATCATLIIALTGALASQILRPNASAVIGDRYGHDWHVTFASRGQVKLYDPQGALIGIAGNQQRTAASGVLVELDVAGAHYQLHPGNQEIRDSNGAQLGFAELIPASDKPSVQKSTAKPVSLLEALRQSEEDETKYGGASGTSASALGVHGWDKMRGLDWNIRGQVKVNVLDAADRVIGRTEGAPLTPDERKQLGANVPPDVPVVLVTLDGRTYREQGYGKHEFHNKAGKMTLRLDVQPLTNSPEATSSPVSSAPAPVR